MPQHKQDGPATPKHAPPHPKVGSDDVLREANRRLLEASLKANEERDAQTALATAMRELLGRGDAGDPALRSEVELLRSITANVSVGLVLLDEGSHPIFINSAAEALFGYTLSEIRDVPFHESVHHHHPDGRPFPLDECVIASAIGTQSSLRQHRDVFVRKDGAFFPVSCDVSPLEIAGKRLGAVLEVGDRSAEAQAEGAKRDLVALIAHDLRTPLASVQGHVQLLRRRASRDSGRDPSEVQSLESIAQGALRMNAMIQELLDASLLESGVVPLSPVPVDITTLVALVVAQLSSTGERERVHVESTPAIIASADKQRIERVTANLLSNALKYSPPHEPVHIDVRRSAGEAVVTVADRGPGIPTEQLPMLFQRFVRVERAQPDPGGFGLGLYIARLIVEAHGGRIWAESRVGSGSTIGFAVPLDVSDAAEAG